MLCVCATEIKAEEIFAKTDDNDDIINDDDTFDDIKM